MSSSTIDDRASASRFAQAADLADARPFSELLTTPDLEIRLGAGVRNVWLALVVHDATLAYMRIGPNAGPIANVQTWKREDGTAGCEFTTALGPVRVKVALHEHAILRCTTSLLPSRDTVMTDWPRDLYCAAGEGALHTKQRGLRSGIVYASGKEPLPFSLFYFQNFSALDAYFNATKTTPADTVGGTWPELGYAPPTGEGCVLPRARETVMSDAYVSLSDDVPDTEGEIAGFYLDKLAQVYELLEKPGVGFHDWPRRAQDALRDLSVSPACTYVRQDRRYLMPYVGDDTKPPESMVQLTAVVNVGEYDDWRNEKSALGEALRDTIPAFFNKEIGTLVRWLPGEPFDDDQAEDNMNHEAMDSWYLHHAAFNAFRVAETGDAAAKAAFEKSLPYLIRVAHRFDYRWPIFFNLKTLDIVRAEAEPGRGGESDVAGLYALVMIHADELLGGDAYLQEAERAVAQLHGLGFDLAYQLNTTGFAAEAALRLWKRTKKRQYLALSEVCLANMFDNMWLWQSSYDHARYYPTFFGLFPLRDAPYLAPYEELEAHAKFHQYLVLGGDDLRPAIRLLLAEYQRYALHRCWYYYPDTVPEHVVAAKPRNGRIERALSVPLEDLQDGREQSGQVGQELYGAGVPFVLTARHFMRLDRAGTLAYCNYPADDFSVSGAVAQWSVNGDVRGACELRIIPSGPDEQPRWVSVSATAGSVLVPLRGTVSAEGHAVFTLRGGQRVVIRVAAGHRRDDAHALLIGARPWIGR